MPGLFDTLSMATRAMQAQQTGVSVSGQNLANVNNPAYARQRVNLETSAPTPLVGVTQGTGVQVAGIQQIRDNLLDAQIRDEGSVGGFWTSSQNALENTQTELGQFLDGSAAAADGTAGSSSATNAQGLSSQFNSLFAAFQSVSADPTSLTQRQVLINQAQGLTNSFNQISTRLSTVNSNLNSSVSTDVDSANKLLSDIASLNSDITKSEAATGSTANDLRDLRQQKLESLAQLTNLQTDTSPDGTLTISIGGVAMVTGGNLTDTLQTFDAGGGQLQVQAAVAGSPLVLNGGSIAGAIGTRDGALANLRSGLDSLASELITQVNTIYSAGYDLNGNSGGSFFSGSDAATIGVDPTLQSDPSTLQAASAPGVTGNNAIALALARLAQQPDAVLGNQTFSGAYGMIVTNLGNALSDANDQVANHNSVNSMLARQRDSVSGVSMEEELTSLMTYQKAYQASAQIISTVNMMLQTVVAMKST